MGEILGGVATVEHELILVASVLFLAFGIDDLVVDAIWIGRAIRRGLFRPQNPVSNASAQPYYAVILPAWQEAAVIGQTIARCLEAYREHRFQIFVACYPNDAETLAIVRSVDDQRVTLALNDRYGPSTKGDNLNSAWRKALRYERSQNMSFDAVILHDAEDWTSDEELEVFSSLLGSFALMQIPVVPVAVEGSPWVSGHYCDEFAESHRRSMIVRQAIGASMPSAGVGCCIRRDLIDRLSAARSGAPFDPDCLTEDYELGLIAKVFGMPSAFIRAPSARPPGIVATRACFPDELKAAVRQKARWITGIALSGWDRTGWGTGLAEKWMRLRDRKTIVEALALLCGYIGAALYLISSIASLALGAGLPAVPGNLATLLQINLVIMIWRLTVRAYCTTRLYGWRQGLISVPRVLTSNLIAVLAARDAVSLYCRMHFSGRTIWEKTSHDRPIDRAAMMNG